MFFPLVIQNTVKREASLVIQPQQVRFNAFFLLTWVIHTQISKNMRNMQKQLLIIYRMCTIELSGNSRKHIEVMPITICGTNIHLGFFAGSIIKQKSQPENMLFLSVFSLPLLVQQNGIFISDGCVTITVTSLFVKTTSSLSIESIKAADFQTENIKAIFMSAFQSFIVNQNFRFDL